MAWSAPGATVRGEERTFMRAEQIARTLGWFSIGLGVAELLAPRRVSRSIGVKGHEPWLRAFGTREIATGIGLLAQPRTPAWLWARVAGDLVDLAALGVASRARRADKTRIAAAAAFVAGATVVDVLASRQVSQQSNGGPGERKRKPGGETHFQKTMIINRPAEELYHFWRNFENLPHFMFHLEEVRVDGDRSHWKAKAPLGGSVEWDAELTEDRPHELIAWRSLPDADVHTAGTVRFMQVPHVRGTVVRVEMDYTPPGGKLGAKAAKLLGRAPEQQVAEDLRRFKQLMETGEIATTEGQPAGRRTSTSRRYDDYAPRVAARSLVTH